MVDHRTPPTRTAGDDAPKAQHITRVEASKEAPTSPRSSSLPSIDEVEQAEERARPIAHASPRSSSPSSSPPRSHTPLQDPEPLTVEADIITFTAKSRLLPVFAAVEAPLVKHGETHRPILRLRMDGPCTVYVSRDTGGVMVVSKGSLEHGVTVKGTRVPIEVVSEVDDDEETVDVEVASAKMSSNTDTTKQFYTREHITSMSGNTDADPRTRRYGRRLSIEYEQSILLPFLSPPPGASSLTTTPGSEDRQIHI